MQNDGSHGGGVCHVFCNNGGVGCAMRSRGSRVILLSIVALVVLCAACSGPSAGTLPLHTANNGLPPASNISDPAGASEGATLVAQVGEFTLYLLPESKALAQQAGEISLSAMPQGQEVIVTANVSGAVGLRGICTQLAYPSKKYSPVSACCGALLGAAEEQLSLCVLDKPGVAELGAVLKSGGKRAGFTGDGELAQVRFARKPFGGVRRASRVPVWDEAKAKLALDVTNARLEWECLLPGDYDGDGAVNVGDVTPLAFDWGKLTMSTRYAYPDPRARLFAFDQLTCADGNKDGTLNLPDLFYLGYHIGEQVSQFCVYHSPDPAADMPEGNAALSKIARAGRAFYASAITDPVTGRKYMRIPILDPTPGDAYWIRPSDGVNEGTPSNYAWYDTSVKDAFSLVVEPVTFLPGGSASFEHQVYTQDENIVVTQSLRNANDLLAFSLDVYFDQDVFNPLSFGTYYLPTSQSSTQRAISCGYTDGILLTTWCSNVLPEGSPNLDSLNDEFIELVAYRLERAPQTHSESIDPIPHGMLNDPLFSNISFNSATGILSWFYSAYGDYDQNGWILFDDLIPLAFHFGKQGIFDTESALFVVDCNHDGVINIEDSRVIGVYFGDRLSGYSIYASSNPNDVPLINSDASGSPPVAPIGYVSFADAEGNPLAKRLRFSANIGAQSPGTYIWVMPEYKGEIGMTYHGEYVLVP